MKLVTIPDYENYRIDAMFDCYKWDPQFLDSNTISKHALVLTKQEARSLARLTELLDQETRDAELFLNTHLSLAKKLRLPKKLLSELKRMKNYDPKRHIRLTRYDFHPTKEGEWAISEVNSDVPGGFAEASLLPKLALQYLNSNKVESIDFGSHLVKALSKKIKKNGTVFFVHCTSYSDDRQVMQYLGDQMEQRGYHALYGAIDHLRFQNQEAISILDGHQGKVDGIVRFTPLEWVKDIKPKTWSGYFDTKTPSCNHPIAIFAQTKRFPFVWDQLESYGLSFSTWRKLLPNTIEVTKKVPPGYLYKPAWGRVGEKISIQEACEEGEYQKILKEVKRHPKRYILQKQFSSQLLESPEGEWFHVCIGSYAVDGKHAGFYARMSRKLRIDSDAEDIPVLIERT